jgi:two-component system phosphate regulon response regulator OmpR
VQEKKNPGKSRIVIVDDDDDLREIMREIAVDEGYDVVALGEGADLVKTVGSFSPQYIVMDLSIPDCDGISLMRSLAAKGCSVPIILVSSHPSRFLDEVRLLGTALGLDIRAALQNPFKVAEFVDCITS